MIGLADAGEVSNPPENVKFCKTSNYYYYFFELCATSAPNRDQCDTDLFDDLLVLQQLFPRRVCMYPVIIDKFFIPFL
jgi:hypothetical protein